MAPLDPKDYLEDEDGAVGEGRHDILIISNLSRCEGGCFVMKSGGWIFRQVVYGYISYKMKWVYGSMIYFQMDHILCTYHTAKLYIYNIYTYVCIIYIIYMYISHNEHIMNL